MTCRSSRQQTSWTLGSSSSRWREKETWASSRLFRNLGEINMILMVVVMFRIRPILRQCWSQRWLWQHCLMSNWPSYLLWASSWISTRSSPVIALAIGHSITLKECSLFDRRFYHPVGHVTHIVLYGYQDILPSSRQNHPYRARWLKLGKMFLSWKSPGWWSKSPLSVQTPWLPWTLLDRRPMVNVGGCYLTFLLLLVYLDNFTKVDYFH